MINYLKNDDLITVKSGFPGNKIINDKFVNYQKGTRPTIKDIIRWQLNFNIQRYKNKFSNYKPVLYFNDNLFNKSKDKIVWLGHASFLITFNGKNILVDPIFKNIPLIRRRVKVPFSLNKPIDVDYILITHAHFDHLDRKTLLLLCKQNPHTVIYCGLRTTEIMRKWGITNTILEAGWWQQFPICEDGIEINFLPAQHWSNRSLKDRNTRLWGSFLIKSASKSIYCMGDSAYAKHFAEIGNLFSDIKYAIMGIGSYTPSNIMQSSHLNPDEAYRGFKDLKANFMIPMHYGTFILSDEPINEPISRIRNLFAGDNKLFELSIGEILLC